MAGIDRFTKQQFEDALPRHNKTHQPLCECAGLVDGEYVYLMPVGKSGKVQIEIRSSIGQGGMSADSGMNSIRAYLTHWDASAKEWRPLGSKVQRWVTRMPGWQKRLTDTLRTLYGWHLDAGFCKDCGEPMGIFKVTKLGNNHGRVFAKCQAHNGFRWLDADPAGSTQATQGAGK